jgi:hypothetical protein
LDRCRIKLWTPTNADGTKKEFKLTVMDESFGEYFKFTQAIFESLPEEGPLQVRVLGAL